MVFFKIFQEYFLNICRIDSEEFFTFQYCQNLSIVLWKILQPFVNLITERADTAIHNHNNPIENSITELNLFLRRMLLITKEKWSI